MYVFNYIYNRSKYCSYSMVHQMQTYPCTGNSIWSSFTVIPSSSTLCSMKVGYPPVWTSVGVKFYSMQYEGWTATRLDNRGC